ncbi:MAG: hypothetical protein E2O42_02610 [Nitrospina sp.]|nr:MAG: hypothetical protein E2O42_02610 [Nitrospina sp.]
MQCDNCGYIFFQPSKKCGCCMAPYAPAPSAFDIGQENLFTIFEMAPGEGGMATSLQANEAGVGLEDYSFTDDYDTGGDHGVGDNALDLSEAESEGYETGYAAEPSGAGDFDTGGTGGLTSYSDDIGPNDFELDLSEALAEQVIASKAPHSDVEAPPIAAAGMPDIAPGAAASEPELEPEAEPSVDISPEGDSSETAEADAAIDKDFGGGGFDSEVEGLGFGFDEPSADTAPEPKAELELPEEEPEIALDDEPSLEIAEEPEIALDDEPSLVLDEDAEYDAVVENPAENMEEDTGEIEFDIDSVDLDAPEPALDVKPQAEPADGDTELEFEGMELEMESPEEPEEDLKK